MANDKRATWRNEAAKAVKRRKGQTNAKKGPPPLHAANTLRIGQPFGQHPNGDWAHIKEIHELCEFQRTPHVHVITTAGSHCLQFPYPSSRLPYPSYLRSSANPDAKVHKLKDTPPSTPLSRARKRSLRSLARSEARVEAWR